LGTPPSDNGGGNGGGTDTPVSGPVASPQTGGGGGSSGSGSEPGGATNTPTGTPGVPPPQGGSPMEWPSPPLPTDAPGPDGSGSAPPPSSPPLPDGQPIGSPSGGNGGEGETPQAPAPSSGGSGDSPTESPPPEICVGDCTPGGGGGIIVTGQAFDSYLQSCTTFIDLNGNQLSDPDEPTGVTDLNGQFNISTGGYGPLVLLAGEQCTDAATGVLLPGNLLAPPGATVITPLTTVLVKMGGGEDAERLLTLSLGLNTSARLTLTSTDAIAAVLVDQDPEAARVVVQNTRLQNIVAMGGAFFSQTGDRTPGVDAMFQALADGFRQRNETENGTSAVVGSLIETGSSANIGTSNDSEIAPGAAGLQMRRLLGLLLEASPDGSVSNLDTGLAPGLSLGDSCTGWEEGERPHCLQSVETGTSMQHVSNRKLASEQRSSEHRWRPQNRRLLQINGGNATNSTDLLNDPTFLGSAVQGASLLLGDGSPVAPTNDTSSDANSDADSDAFALVAATMALVNSELDAPLTDFLLLDLAGGTNRSAAIEFLNEIWRRSKVAQSNFADVMVQLGAGGVNVSEASAMLTPGAFQNLLTNTTLVLSPGGEQAILQAQAGSPPPPGDVEFPPSAARGNKHRAWWFWVAVLVPICVGVLLLCCCCGGVWYCCKKKRGKTTRAIQIGDAGTASAILCPIRFWKAFVFLRFMPFQLSFFVSFVPCFGLFVLFDHVSNTLQYLTSIQRWPLVGFPFELSSSHL
jgi:hypothetical protein